MIYIMIPEILAEQKSETRIKKWWMDVDGISPSETLNTEVAKPFCELLWKILSS